jgi:hypothetical protein
MSPIGTNCPFAAPHKFVSFRGETCRAEALTPRRAVDPEPTQFASSLGLRKGPTGAKLYPTIPRIHFTVSCST